MKRYVPLAVVLAGLSLAPGYAEKPHRFVEIGVDARGGAANNLIGLTDMLKKHIVFDTSAMKEDFMEEGLTLNTDVLTNVFLNVNIGEAWGFGLSMGVSGGIYGNVPASMLHFIAEGNADNPSPRGDISAYGGVFADANLNVHTKIKRLKLGFTPALFVPLVYIPKSSINYRLEDQDSLLFTTNGEINVYSAISLENLDDLEITDSLIVDLLSKTRGFDLSLNAEFAVIPNIFDLGLDVTHIPIVPATLEYRMNVTADFVIDGSDLISGNSLDIDLEDKINTDYSAGHSYNVSRPLRFDLYSNIYPFKKEIFTLRPNIGFTVLTPSKEPFFNAGLDMRLNLWRVFYFHLGTGYDETIWKHEAGFAFNFRVLELIVEAGLRSQDFLSSFQLKGFSAGVGVRFGI
ncbi:MAG: hypothetical protein LBD24_07950 [Spirochaetaceae bacterium]|jgi:hypothetical protein|nr:hypothetical protein [Spirochaetaceae bacterium]